MKNKMIKVVLCFAMILAVVLAGFGCSPKNEITDTESTGRDDATSTSTSATTTETKKDDTTGETTTKKTEPTTNKQTGTIDMYKDTWYLNLLNGDYKLADDFAPKLATVAKTVHEMDARVAPHYNEMFEAAASEGIYLTPVSGYRSVERQRDNFNREVKMHQDNGDDYDTAYAKARAEILPPGTSEHNAGLAMDIGSITENFENTSAFTWLRANAHKYGFILRYPKGKENITNIIYEPWHWRYIGKQDAGELRQLDITLEEYLQKKGLI